MFDRRVRSCKAGNGYTEWRATNIVIADHMAEFDRIWIAAMLATDANLKIGPCFAPVFDGYLHQAPYAIPIQGLEGILR